MEATAAIKIPKYTLPETRADAILEDKGNGHGLIIIRSVGHGAFSHYWSAMGCDLDKFIMHVNSDYFAGKLCDSSYTFDSIGSTRNLRRFIREDLSFDLPWWTYMDQQKEMREEIKALESTRNEHDFASTCADIPNRIFSSNELNDECDQRKWGELMHTIFCSSPWDFITTKPSKEYNFLIEVHAELKTVLKESS